MLTITYRIPSAVSSGIRHYIWHVDSSIVEGDRNEFSMDSEVEDLSRIVSVYADGDELEWIEKNFTNLPLFKGRSTTYFGDMARTIVAALP